ncbi:MAG TPA: sensor histidine kinase [Actinomycetes bacterium]|nr:sensor histidine kinase [Actinomycetes bacterium]
MTRRNWAFDAAIVAVTLALGQLEAWYGVNATHRQGPHWAEALAYGIGALLLIVRRTRPMLCLAGMVAAYVVEFALVGSPEGWGVAVPPMIAAYSVGRWERRYPTWWALPIGAALGACWVGFDPMNDTATTKLAALVWMSPWFISWLVGALVRSRAQNAEARRLAREQRAQQAVAEERTRIARELHDVIGHTVSVMTVQASAVRRRLTPEQTVEREALETVEAAGREALAEMRRMVGVLRDQGHHTDGDGREPPPGLGQVDRLVEKFRTAGLPVRVTVSGTAQPLAPGLDLTAYRLLQEGLTNTLRHAAAPHGADVSIAYGADCLELAVRDDGRPVTAPGEAGHGLLGMKERVSVYGGQLVARPRPEGGFELIASLPLVSA